MCLNITLFLRQYCDINIAHCECIIYNLDTNFMQLLRCIKKYQDTYISKIGIVIWALSVFASRNGVYKAAKTKALTKTQVCLFSMWEAKKKRRDSKNSETFQQ